MPDARDIVGDPEWTPLGFDASRSAFLFARMTRRDAARAAFLDERAAAAISARAVLPAAEIAPLIAPPGRLPAFVFHTSFCCSTLLARALDVEGKVLALKEPNILLDLANALRVHEGLRRDQAAAGRLIQTVFALLGRPARGERAVLVKPTNAANSLLPAALAAGAPVLLLYGSLRDYLVSILKKGEEGRAFVRQQFNIFALDGGGLAAIPQRQALGFTDLQIAALVWRRQIEQFAGALADFPAARLAALDFRALLARPAAALKAAARHLDLPLAEADAERAAASDIFARDSKFEGRGFDAAARDAEEAAVLAQWGETVALIEGWGAALDLGIKTATPLPRALALG